MQEQEQRYKAHIHALIQQNEGIRHVHFSIIHDYDLAASIYTHCVDEATFQFFNRMERGQTGAFKGHTLLSVSDYLEEEDNLDAKWYPNQKVEDISFPENRIFFLRKSKHGRHRIGGPLPEGYTKPVHPDLKTPFQYIGTIDGTDPKFSWLGADKLHLAFPVNECLSRVFLDYSNPAAPTVINLVNHSDAWFSTSGRVRDIEYQQVNYEVYEDVDAVNFEDLEEMNVCGVPVWYNDPVLHRCPRTGRIMRFVCSINSDTENQILNPQFTFPDRRNPDTFLNFVHPVHLFVFMCPESRILYITR
ncbi:hypothetical protein [Paenibacillus sp. MMS20-IR301]|uniref:hypothetical protein n=1 Tax=Paenibacillus sp. MMS20-IR301 TaxID=2895946 RepID=UPI0028EA938A|nr:hypothetical protein [Paenibacillus sp. MMS20-IR301]WNS46318.1 hypothetical protein LOS79_13970 [Paenibacillus sp. MMS20-IR301]